MQLIKQENKAKTQVKHRLDTPLTLPSPPHRTPPPGSAVGAVNLPGLSIDGALRQRQ